MSVSRPAVWCDPFFLLFAPSPAIGTKDECKEEDSLEMVHAERSKEKWVHRPRFSFLYPSPLPPLLLHCPSRSQVAR